MSADGKSSAEKGSAEKGSAETGTVAVVAIGRNEGERLERCLRSLVGQADRIVYVDSGSTDGSVDFARSLGVKVVELDMSTPFTAARARNAGFEALKEDGLPDYVQFVDGDCAVEPGWIDAGREALDADETLGIVTCWRTEIEPDATVYNAMCEVEWHRPAGEIVACGGDMMVRTEIFQRVGGFNPTVIASEDDELCLRVGKAGKRIVRLPKIMTRHDANMTRFVEWWQRTVRNGHGFAEVGRMHPPHFQAERRRVVFYGGVLPGLALVATATGVWIAIPGIGAIYFLSWAKTVKGLVELGLSPREAAHQAVYLTLSKIPNMQGMLTYYRRRLLGREARIIEYK